VAHFHGAEHLDAVWMNQVEVADKGRCINDVAADQRAATALAAYPGQAELLAIILMQPRDADLEHWAATR
jgi:hypothetical protein